MISKILSSLIFSLFIEQNIYFQETCFAYTTSEPKFMVCRGINTAKFFAVSLGNYEVLILQKKSNFMIAFCPLIFQRYKIIVLLLTKATIQ